MARLIFCFFAESTGIFLPRLFTETIRQMSDSQSGNMYQVIADLFWAMDTKIEDRKAANFRPWAEALASALNVDAGELVKRTRNKSG